MKVIMETFVLSLLALIAVLVAEYAIFHFGELVWNAGLVASRVGSFFGFTVFK